MAGADGMWDECVTLCNVLKQKKHDEEVLSN